MTTPRVYLLLAVGSLLSNFPLLVQASELKLAPVFSEHMVLQREMPLPVWGEAAAGETVTVEFAGQSNMAMSVGSSADAEREIAGAIHPEIRIFRVPANPAREPVVDFKAAWEVCSPETAAGFSAVGYFFGREIQPAVGVPVGLLV